MARWPLFDTDGAVSLLAFGAKGDGSGDDTNAVLSAIAAGVPLIGHGRTYAVAGNIAPTGAVDLSDIKFKQLTPGDTNVRTLFIVGNGPVRLRRVTVDRNGTGTEGNVSDYAGIWIQANDVDLDHVEVFGAGYGKGITFINCSRVNARDLYVHDLMFSAASDPGSEQIDAIRVGGCADVNLYNTRLKNILSNLGGVQSSLETHGLGVSNSTDLGIYGGILRNAGTGIDCSGAGVNFRIKIIGVTAIDNYYYGFKLTHQTTDADVVGCISLRSGSVGYIVPGGTNADPSHTAGPSNITFTNCIAVDTGANSTIGTTTYGFQTTASDFTPSNIVASHCRAIDRQATPTMNIGFGRDTDDSSVFRLIGPMSSGHTSAAYHNFSSGVYEFLSDGSLNVTGAVSTTKGLSVTGRMNARRNSMTLASGLNSDIPTVGSYYSISGPTAAFSLGGFTNGNDGDYLDIYNATSQAMTIKNLDASSTSGNRIVTLTGADVTLRTGKSFASFVYSSLGTAWLMKSSN